MIETEYIQPETIDASSIKNVESTFINLHRYLKQNDYKGWEYDDLLASKPVNTLTFNSLWLKIAAVQVAKRSPINLRPLLRVPKLHSTKAFGFITKGYLLHDLYTGDEKYRADALQSLEWLLKNACKGYSGYCWGNDFDFASRAGFFPKEIPTIVWTSHIQEAFEMAYQSTGDSRYLDVVHSVADFIVNDLDRIEDKSGFCFAYAPGINFPIHNSNLLGMAAVLRSYKYSRNAEYLEIAKRSCNWSVTRQNIDGSWYYGDKPMLHWIDNYHTGYNLDCLSTAYEIAGDGFLDEKVIESTYSYWIKNLFDQDMAPRFYNTSSYPRDIQATAQAIETFCKMSVKYPDALAKAVDVFNWASGNMLQKNGSFAYRIYKSGKRNNLEAIHWGQATMLSSMGHILYYSKLKHK